MMHTTFKHRKSPTSLIPASPVLLPRPAGSSCLPPAHEEPRYGHDFGRIEVDQPHPAARACPWSSAGPRACPFGGACHACPARIQAKLAVGRHGDAYEQEAERMAEQVMQVAETPALSPQTRSASGIQRKCTDCEDEEQDGIQAKEIPGREPGIGGGPDVPTSVHEALNSPGQPLDPSARSFMEPRFGTDFRQVRVHQDAKAARSARAIGALAYTVGPDVVFGSGQYSPKTEKGQKLIAHELSHVVQQRGTTPIVQMQEDEDAPPRSEQVWGFPVTRRMCRCRQKVEQQIAWCGIEMATYMGCDTPDNPTLGDVQDCFRSILPMAKPVYVTTAGGTVESLQEPPRTPCERLIDHGLRVHERFHIRREDRLAQSLGTRFWEAWHRVGRRGDRLDLLRPEFPKEVAEYETVFFNGHDLMLSEMRSGLEEIRFLHDVLAALNRICAAN